MDGCNAPEAFERKLPANTGTDHAGTGAPALALPSTRAQPDLIDTELEALMEAIDTLEGDLVDRQEGLAC
ncbi:hypothetical protein [Stenotrophomonas sp. RAC2]|uniref:hypothetical protein n=1 Tax=Stenotrophomonas sp. RAC2 TaxID=3064902 RepID=UPI00271B3A0A|nr:hypothetical protein [Stenotrophomonas sp. RAC2]MDV9041974.1 hypothetical protein [Stenotrophomonas sp. RAC2]